MWAGFPFLLVSTGLASSSPATTERSDPDLGRWEISHFRRVCLRDDSKCDFSFSLAEVDAEPAPCSFTINGKDDVPASQRSFEHVQCEETDTYSINSGWNEEGFIVFVVSKAATYDSRALVSWFGFKDEDLVDGFETKLQDWEVHEGHPALEPGAEMLLRRQGEGGDDLNYAEQWTVVGVFRYPIEDPDEPGVSVSFIVEEPGYESVQCEAVAYGEAGVDPKNMSFYDVGCGGSAKEFGSSTFGSDWSVSWGHDQNGEEGSAVMTVMK